ncbi:glycosyltransferase [bacterium]|nr:glycosyltransferase [bacterium]
MSQDWIPLARCPQPYFSQNILALNETQPSLVSILEAHCRRSDIFVQQDAAGLLACAYRNPSGFFVVHGPDSVQRNADAFSTPIIKGFQDSIWLAVVFGIGMGTALPAVITFMEKELKGQAKGLLCMEQDPGLLCAGFCLYNMAPLIATGRLLFASGPNLLQAVKDLFHFHRFETLDDSQMRFYAGSKITEPEREEDYRYTLQQCKAYHAETRQAYFDLLKQGEAYWSKPSQTVKRVWTQVNHESGGGKLLLGLAEGFHELGLQSKSLCFQDRLFTRFYRCAYDFFAFQPDMMLSLNHSSDYTASFAKPVPIPRLVWFVDHPRRTVHVPFHPHDWAIAVAESFFAEVRQRGGRPLGEVPAACSGSMEKPPLSPQWKHDVSYVGSVVDCTPILQNLDGAARTWVDDVVEQLLAEPEKDLETIIQETRLAAKTRKSIVQQLPAFFSKAAYMREEALLSYFLYVEANARRRIRLMSKLECRGHVGIYGPKDWLALLPERLHSCFQGPIQGTRELIDLYQNCKVTLSINSLQGFRFINPRVFEVPASGGFLLTEYVPGLETFFDKEKELPWFTTPEEMNEQIALSLKDEGERLAMISRMQRKLKAEHTFKHRAQLVLELWERRQAE